MPDKLARLMAIGFTRVGAWRLDDRGLTFDIVEGHKAVWPLPPPTVALEFGD
jgi:hypothetical protein